MILVYFRGKGRWFDFPNVDSPNRVKARKQWQKAHPIPKGTWDENEEGWEKFQADKKKWEESNPPPKYTVVEDTIYLETNDFFELSTPYLEYDAPEEIIDFGVFQLKKDDETILRYEKKVTVQTLLPCNHPDANNNGFFFQPNEPHTFFSKDIVLNEPDTLTNNNITLDEGGTINQQDKKKENLTYQDLFTNAPQNVTEPFTEISSLVTHYIKDNNKLPSRAELWSCISTKPLTKDMDKEAFNTNFKRWTKTDKKR